MSTFNITDQQKSDIANTLQQYFKNNGIQGEVTLVFTQNFTPEDDDDENKGPCNVTLDDGSVVVQNPCRR